MDLRCGVLSERFKDSAVSFRSMKRRTLGFVWSSFIGKRPKKVACRIRAIMGPTCASMVLLFNREAQTRQYIVPSTNSRRRQGYRGRQDIVPSTISRRRQGASPGMQADGEVSIFPSGASPPSSPLISALSKCVLIILPPQQMCTVSS